MPFVHATVVLVERPASARAGDEAIVFADGTIEGFVGGTCAESTVRAQSLTLLDSGEPLLLRVTASPVAGQPVTSNRLTVTNPCLSGGTIEIFLEPVIPSPVLVVHGDSPIATALAALGERLGYQVVAGAVPHPSAPGLPSPELSGAAALVCASHGRDEEAVLSAALSAGVGYVGLVASRKRGESVVASLDLDEAARARVHTPAGLDIGARTPAEVALSILAEIVTERRRASGRPVALQMPVAEEPATAIDPVCGMSVAAVDTSLHLDHEGRRHWFCGSGCLRAFAANPVGYVTS
ncbi:MAG: XdhC family protein [Nocardioidaceae bacterium]